MKRTKLGLKKNKEPEESKKERYKCHRLLKKCPLVKLDSRNKNITLLSKNIGSYDKYVNILIGKGYAVSFDLFYNI